MYTIYLQLNVGGYKPEDDVCVLSPMQLAQVQKIFHLACCARVTEGSRKDMQTYAIVIPAVDCRSSQLENLSGCPKVIYGATRLYHVDLE